MTRRIWLREPRGDHLCADHRLVFDGGEVVVAMAQNNGVALTGERYDQTYVHIFKSERPFARSMLRQRARQPRVVGRERLIGARSAFGPV